MAAKRRSGRFGKRGWTPNRNDAIRLAALRWLATEIEQLGIEIYATDKAKYILAEKLIRKAVYDLREMRAGALEDSEGCPDGYVRCNDGYCSPMCTDVEE